jgi:predicted nucleic acid-binding protein
MISSSSRPLDRGLDTMVLVYSLLQGHPATTACEQMLRSHTSWFTSTLVLLEAKAVLTKVYNADPKLVTQKLDQVASGSVTFIDLASVDVVAAFQLADTFALDFTDAVLLHLAQSRGSRVLATDDQRLSQICPQFGVTALSPLDATLRQAVSAWEASHLPPKGLPRVLRRIHDWIGRSDPHTAQDFWSHTGAGSHLP